MWMTQTPQAFKYELVKSAYDNMQKERNANVTDDAMVVEQFTNHEVHFVEGAYGNIKITTPEDIKIAEVLLAEREKMKKMKNSVDTKKV